MTFSTDAVRRTCTARRLIDSPLGSLLLARTARGLAGAWFMDQKDHPGELPGEDDLDDPLLEATTQRLNDYFAGRAVGFDDLPLDLQGTPFQRAVWGSLLRIPRGHTCAYGDIAREIATMTAVRAVGSAVGKNPVAIIVPCHRVIGAGGSLTGYAGGLHRKRELLIIEGVLPAQQQTRELFEEV